MSRQDLIPHFTWAHYSKNLMHKIESPHHAGSFTEDEARSAGFRLVESDEGAIAEGNMLRLYWLVDETDGVITEAKFQVFGYSALIAAAEAVCDLVIGKNYDQARRISADLIEKHILGDGGGQLPEELGSHLNLVLSVLDLCGEKCSDIPVADDYVSPVPSFEEGAGEGYPGWDELTLKQKLSVIEEILDKDIRPYIAMDQGGIAVIGLEGDKLKIAYSGSCTSCYSAIGTTLNAIQDTLRTKANPKIVVEPDMDQLEL